ncbi:hypothetical protein [Paenibacillus mendelii]|uniref:hypothetical protein n=1 Tax=Paenibacillus mendelii TaxID=206163 RepID=UPI001D95E8D9
MLRTGKVRLLEYGPGESAFEPAAMHAAARGRRAAALSACCRPWTALNEAFAAVSRREKFGWYRVSYEAFVP